MSVFDIEAIKRFCDGVKKNQEINHKKFLQYKLSGSTGKVPKQNFCNEIEQNDIAQAAFALSCLVYGGTDLKKELNIRKKSNNNKKRLDYTIHSPEFSVVMSYVAGDIGHKEAIQILKDEYFVEKTEAGNFLRDRKKAAEKIIKITPQIYQKKSGVTDT